MYLLIRQSKPIGDWDFTISFVLRQLRLTEASSAIHSSKGQPNR